MELLEGRLLLGVQEVPSSNLGGPTKTLNSLQGFSLKKTVACRRSMFTIVYIVVTSGRVARLRHRFERRRAFFLDYRNVLLPERVPAETREVDTQFLRNRADGLPQKIAVIQRTAVLVEHEVFLPRGCRFPIAICLRQQPQRQLSAGVSGFGVTQVSR